MFTRSYPLIVAALVMVLVTAFGAGCSRESGLTTRPDAGLRSQAGAPSLVNPAPPSDLVTVSFGGQDMTFWPYTGATLDGTPSDPMNLVFFGKAGPAEIRAALMALDGNRSGFGYPDVFPFNATWSDAIGDVQATYADPDGWVGSVIQLQLGMYEPIRFHLRLFRTGLTFEGGEVTLGAAHFEVLIPGTADHQVLSWEKAEEIVTVDLIRSGLLDATTPVSQTGLINAAPSFREIPAIVYNEIPVELKAYIGGPLGEVTEAVPILTNGSATILNIATAAEIVAGTAAQSFTMTYGQLVPKPLCVSGPADYVYVSGPVNFNKSVTVDSLGSVLVDSNYDGRLSVTPWDIFSNTPAGDPYPATVRGRQHAVDNGAVQSADAFDQRMAKATSAEMLSIWLRLSSPGADSYKITEQCR